MVAETLEMKLFQVVLKNFSILGISSDHSKLNGKLVKTFLIYALGGSLSVAFLFYEAKTFMEYTSNIYVTTAIAVISTYFTILTLKSKKFFKLIDNLMIFIDESAYVSYNA